MTRRRTFLLVLLLVSTLSAWAQGGEPDDLFWRQVADPEDPGHEAALEAWSDMEAPQRAERVRAGLRSADPAVARLAAEVADPFTLDLTELRRAAALAATDPAWVADPQRRIAGGMRSDGTGFGRPDVVAMWRTAATTEGFELVVRGDDDPSDEFHRAMDASHAIDLVPLLETKNAEVKRRLARWLHLVAAVTTHDETRPVFARGFLYLIAREAAERAGTPIPTLASIEVKAEGPGIPPALTLLLRQELRKSAESSVVLDPWLLRWARDTVPTAADLALLMHIESTGTGLPTLRAWAIRGLAALDPEGRSTVWPALAERGDAAAAAELARQGDPAPLRELAEAEGGAGGAAWVLSWEVDAERARARHLDSIAKAEVPGDVVSLSPFQRADYEIEWGVTIRDADLRAIGQALAEGESPRRGCAWFHANAIPEAINPEVARAIAKRLLATSDDLQSGEELDHEDLDATLAQLEVRAPDVLRDLLYAWAEGPPGSKRERALVGLARLGDARHVPAMLASWGGEDAESWSTQAQVLGRVKDPRVEAYLRARLEAGAPEDTTDELMALAVYHGLPEGYGWIFASLGDVEEPEPYTTLRARVLAGDVNGAALALAEHGQGIGELSQVKTPEALDALQRIRRERFAGGYAAYWPATEALAAAGDVDARREWLGFLRDGRVRMNDSHEIRLPGQLGSDPEVIDTLISQLDSNCCLGWQAYVGLEHAYPTAPMDNIGPHLGRNRVAAERWFAQHRGTFAWSRLLDGYVPGPAQR